jgi:hypothetical protein
MTMPSAGNAAVMAAFCEWDSDNSGKVDVNELVGIMSKLGINVTKARVMDMVKEVDSNNDGEIDLSEFAQIVAKANDGAAGLAGVVHKKNTSGPPLVWQREDKKVGDGIEVSPDGELVSRSARQGSGVQVVDCKLANAKDSYDKATIAVECEVLAGETLIGLVGINYLDWSAPLHESKHCAVVRTCDGEIILKGAATGSSVGAIKNGHKLVFQIDMAFREMTIEVLSPDNLAERTVKVDSLPPEVCFAASLGQGENRVRLTGSCTQQSRTNRSRRSSKDLWDEENSQALPSGSPEGKRVARSALEDIAASLG